MFSVLLRFSNRIVYEAYYIYISYYYFVGLKVFKFKHACHLEVER